MFSAMTLEGRMNYFQSSATIRQLLVVLLREIKARKGQKKRRQGVNYEDMKYVIRVEFELKFSAASLEKRNEVLAT
jgi:hypothetical protein